MRHSKLLFTAAIGAFVLLSAACGRGNGQNQLRLATFNIRYGTPKDTAERSWEARREACRASVVENGFDIVGFQEALPRQQEDLRRMLPQYTFMFVGRDNGTDGEAVGIAYRSDRIAAVDSGRFWLSPTPEIPSNSLEWGGLARHRVAAWYILEDRQTGKRLGFLSTHMEVSDKSADYFNVREKSAKLIISREKEINPEGIPFFVVGDMNPLSQEEPMLLKMRETFEDTYHSADSLGLRTGPTGTFNGFNPDAEMDTHSKRGDYIFGKGAYSLLGFRTIDTRYEGQYPSDHIPVMIIITLD